MLTVSLDQGPKNEKILQKLMVPYSLVFSPGSLSQEIQTLNETIEEFPRCQKCRAYLSSFCKIDQTNLKWTCSICNEESSFPASETEIPKLISNDLQFIDRSGFLDEIIVIYISLNYQLEVYQLISTSLTNILKTVKIDKPILFLFSSNDSYCSILCPYESHYQKDPNTSTICRKEHFEQTIENDQPAPIFNFSLNQFVKEDISQFLFSADQIPSAIRTISQLYSNAKVGFSISATMKTCDCIREMIFQPGSRLFNPIHFILIVPQIDNFLSTKLVQNFYKSFCRIDILTSIYNKEAHDTAQILPGCIFFMTESNIQRTFSKLLIPPFLESSPSISNENLTFKQILSRYGKPGIGTIYEFSSNVRSNGANLTWRLSQSPYTYNSNCYAFGPTLPSIYQPFVLDIQPTGKTNEIYIQITAKMVMLMPKIPNIDSDSNPDSYYSTHYATVMRIFNRKLELTENIQEIVESLNVNTFLWLCMTRTIEKSSRDVLAALYRTVAKIVNILLPKTEVEGENADIKKKYADLLHGCCSLQYSNLMSRSAIKQMMAKYSLLLSPPSMYTLVPYYSEQNKYAIFGNTVYVDEYTDESSPQEGNSNVVKPKIISTLAGEALSNMLFMEEFDNPVPDWFRSIDQHFLDFLNSLL